MGLWPFSERCKHYMRICVHGDEINLSGGARAKCWLCGKYLKKAPLPYFCGLTMRPHKGMNDQGPDDDGLPKLSQI